jgi:transposase
MADASMGNEL